MILLALAALIAVARLSPDARPLALLLPLAAYAAPLFNPPRAVILGAATPLLLLALAGWFLAGSPPKTPLLGCLPPHPRPRISPAISHVWVGFGRCSVVPVRCSARDNPHVWPTGKGD